MRATTLSRNLLGHVATGVVPRTAAPDDRPSRVAIYWEMDFADSRRRGQDGGHWCVCRGEQRGGAEGAGGAGGGRFAGMGCVAVWNWVLGGGRGDGAREESHGDGGEVRAGSRVDDHGDSRGAHGPGGSGEEDGAWTEGRGRRGDERRGARRVAQLAGGVASKRTGGRGRGRQAGGGGVPAFACGHEQGATRGRDGGHGVRVRPGDGPTPADRRVRWLPDMGET